MKNGTKNLRVCSMKIGLNPAVSSVNGVGLNRGVKKSNQPAFQAVNQKLLKEAEDWYRRRGNINTTWYDAILDGVILFKEISKQDAIDTINAARKYVNAGSMEAYDTLLKDVQNA